MEDTSDIPADKLTKAYIKIRAKRAELSARYKEEDGVLVRQQEILKNALLDYCENHNVESVRTSEGLAKPSIGPVIGNKCTVSSKSMMYLSS
jgi:flagellar basal body-associated protein FliL